jgi:L-fuconolactonase
MFSTANALQHSFIKGVVGWVDLQADDLTDHLEYYKEFKSRVFGMFFRNQRDFMLTEL